MAPPPTQDTKSMPDKIDIPKDQSKPAQAASPVATLSSHVDPYPHYAAAAGCAGASWLQYSRLANQRAAAASAGFALLYISAGRMVETGKARWGYDLGSASSLGLLAWAAPMASANAAGTVLATVGGLSSVANLIKSYQYRTGKPHEAVEH